MAQAIPRYAAMSPLLSISGLTCRRDDGTGSAVLHNFDLNVDEGEVVILRGPSGCGKTTLLRCVAELEVYQSGEILLYGRSATQHDVPVYRTLVRYVPQRPSLLPGTPLDFLTTIRAFASRHNSASMQAHDSDRTPSGYEMAARSDAAARSAAGPMDPLELAEQWGVDKLLWTRDWSRLSGGEAQRIALAAAIGLGGADIILLDEPTSALDEESMLRVERSLVGMLPRRKADQDDDGMVDRAGGGPKAILWITHSDAQAERVGTRVVNLGRFPGP